MMLDPEKIKINLYSDSREEYTIFGSSIY